MNDQTPAPLVVQSDLTLLLDVNTPDYETVRDFLAQFAELVKSPEYVHTYRITPLSLWNAAAANVRLEKIVEGLQSWSRYPVSDKSLTQIEEYYNRFGQAVLEPVEGERERFLLTSQNDHLTEVLTVSDRFAKRLTRTARPDQWEVSLLDRGLIKQMLIEEGFPVSDLAGFAEGEPLPIDLLEADKETGKPFGLRDYQKEAADVFYLKGDPAGGHGVVVLPCGAGKTIVGLAAMSRVQERTLILCPNVVSVRQWIRELKNRLNLDDDQIGEYTGSVKEIKPVTVATYHVVVHRPKKDGGFPHFGLLTDNSWGLIIYDEVHLLPAPIFRVTAEIQAKRRLGLTATLIREDGREAEVFALIGPKRFDVPWKVMEAQGWIAHAECVEVRVPLSRDRRRQYAQATKKQRARLAAENPLKDTVVANIIQANPGEPILVIGHYINQLRAIAKRLNAPLITGQTSEDRREKLYAQFRAGELPVLVVSRVANFAIDLPDAAVAVEISGIYGSRQEEAQRLGRILRPKDRTSYFYSIVSKDTVDEDFGANRQMFLTEHGYHYRLEQYELEDLVRLHDELEMEADEELIPQPREPAEALA